ncbi:MAG TPA: hypothetical protein VIH42_05345, partial [Thermoguttaceae bacterium]
WMAEPDATMRLRFNTFYALVRLLVENKPIEPPADQSTTPAEGKTPLRLPDLPLKELGPRE